MVVENKSLTYPHRLVHFHFRACYFCQSIFFVTDAIKKFCFSVYSWIGKLGGRQFWDKLPWGYSTRVSDNGTHLESSIWWTKCEFTSWNDSSSSDAILLVYPSYCMMAYVSLSTVEAERCTHTDSNTVRSGEQHSPATVAARVSSDTGATPPARPVKSLLRFVRSEWLGILFTTP